MTLTTNWLPVRVDDWPAWLTARWHEGARRVQADPVEAPAVNDSNRAIGGRVTRDGRMLWLRVTPFDESCMSDHAWRGTRDAAQLAGVRRPELLEHAEWVELEPTPIEVCADLLAYVPDAPVTKGLYLTEDPQLPEDWYGQLRGAFEALASSGVDRCTWYGSPEQCGQVVHAFYGELPAGIAPEWGVEHHDMGWHNVTSPNLWILDWEHWGRAPRGLAAARMYCHSLAVPHVAGRLYEEFADVLDSPSGRYAQLVIVEQALSHLAGVGDPVGLAPRLRALAEGLLGRR